MDEFYCIIENIINNKEFVKLKNIRHHCYNRYDHSFTVAYYTYKITRFLRIDYKSATRGALLHDFFFEKNKGIKTSKKVKNIYNHPNYALTNSLNYYDLNKIEKDIIITHMFPINIRVPKYLESWIVDFIDDYVTIIELNSKFKYKVAYISTIAFMFIIKTIK